MKTRLAEFEELSAAEEILRDAVQRGVTAGVSGGVPEAATPEVTIRASFIRYLALGGCDACRPAASGVQVKGAYIAGDGDPERQTAGLDLGGCDVRGDLCLVTCAIPNLILLHGAQCKTLRFDFCRLGAGLIADGLRAEGGIGFFKADILDEVCLSGARVSGNLDFDHATLRAGANGLALSADHLHADGDVTLRRTEISGTVRLSVARIGGHLDCDGAKLRAADAGIALKADGLQAEGTFSMRDNAVVDGVLDLTGATVAAIADDQGSWPQPRNLLLDRFRYGAILGGPVDMETRLKWLSRQDPTRFGQNFWPQPYEHLARVLRDMGHGEDAKQVLIGKERLLRADRRNRMRHEGQRLRAVADWLADWFLWGVLAYGQRPLRAVLWLLGFWGLGVVVFGAAASNDAIKPNNAFVLRAPEWAACDPNFLERENGPAKRWTADETQLACFQRQPEAAAYPRFNAFVYSADTVLPIVDLEMQANWIPDERHAPWARWFLWAQVIAGWGLSLLAVAGFSGLVKSE